MADPGTGLVEAAEGRPDQDVFDGIGGRDEQPGQDASDLRQ